VKALCIGASCVFFGRLPLYGLAREGRLGVEKTLDMINRQVCEALDLVGCDRIKDLSTNLLQSKL
jgi:isopentenyl diphosphate isomerase/L-lactate dehydrogenase-like FMN-dependent dehydrogenase